MERGALVLPKRSVADVVLGEGLFRVTIGLHDISFFACPQSAYQAVRFVYFFIEPSLFDSGRLAIGSKQT